MGKKYVPSGYQIINLKFDNIESGSSVDMDAETDDEKILVEILKEAKINKPILINCVVNDSFKFSQYALRIATDTILLGDPTKTNGSSLQIQWNGGSGLTVNFTEI